MDAPPDTSSLRRRIEDLRDLLGRLDDRLLGDVIRAADMIAGAFSSGGKVLAFGNGGSASDAAHFTAEFVGRFLVERRGLPAISLAAETAAVTAIGNDYGFERLFERQIEALGRPGDVALGLTTSGRSPNVLKAIEQARGMDLRTIALTGANGLIGATADLVLAVPSARTYEIQEVQKVLLHAICAEVDARMAVPHYSP
jgi:D-sedoheptulose 7-phosphate isomerase